MQARRARLLCSLQRPRHCHQLPLFARLSSSLMALVRRAHLVCFISVPQLSITRAAIGLESRSCFSFKRIPSAPGAQTLRRTHRMTNNFFTLAWMVAWKKRMEELGDVVAFDYDYMKGGKGGPGQMPTLISNHRTALELAKEQFPDRPVVLAGKSLGSRVGCNLSAAEKDAGIAAVICFGYPLKGQNGSVRNETLLSMHTPVLFLQGTKDSFCPLIDLEKVRDQMKAKSALHVVETGNHSLEVMKSWSKKTGINQAAIDAAILKAIHEFLGQQLPPVLK